MINPVVGTDDFNGRNVLRRLRLLGEPEFKPGSLDPVRTLIATILSQNTSRENMMRAVNNLERRGLLSLEALARADLRAIQDSIRVAGLWRQRARRLKMVAKLLIERFGGDLNQILKLPTPQARRILLELPGVGLKTADILLLFSGGRPVFPVDTHIFRISRHRWGLVRRNAGYEEVRRALEEFFPRSPENYLLGHIGMIRLGRRFCRARQPLCGECILRDICPYVDRAKLKFGQ